MIETLEMALNPLDRYKGTKAPDEVRKSDVVIDKTIEGVLENYEQALDFSDSTWHDYIKALAYKTILTPEQITQFLKATKAFESCNNYVWNTGYFVSGLIQASYDAGHNDFVLDTRNLPALDYLCAKVEGKEEKHLKVIIDGKAGSWCGLYAKYLVLKAQKVEAYCPHKSSHCEIKIQKAEVYCRNPKLGFCISDFSEDMH